MSVNALLAWFGMKAAPHFHDVRVHDARNDEAAMVCGFRCVARASVSVARAISADPADTAGIEAGVAHMQTLTASIASRTERIDRTLGEVIGVQRGDDIA